MKFKHAVKRGIRHIILFGKFGGWFVGWMSSGNGTLALRWTVLKLGEVQALFYCHVRILAFHYFVKDASTSVFCSL
jgi:hypothetical protein